MNLLEQNELYHRTMRLAEMADDFLIYIIMVKSNPENFKEMVSLPFIHGHALELSIKSACLHIGVKDEEFSKVGKNGHNIIGLYDLLCSKTIIKSTFPSKADMNAVESFFTKTQISELPKDLDTLDLLEMAFFCKNVIDLKYGSHKDGSNISNIGIEYKHINHIFLNFFKEVRKIYSNVSLDARFKKILNAHFALMKHSFTPDQINKYIEGLLN